MQPDPNSRVNQLAEARVIAFAEPEPHPWPTRAELLAEGDLIAVPRPVARQAGWRVPVAISRGVYGALVRDPDGPARREPGQEFNRYETGRLWWVCRAAVFKVALGTPQEKDAPEIWVTVDKALLVLHRGPDDLGEPVATLCLEAER